MMSKEPTVCPFCGSKRLKVEGKNHNLYMSMGVRIRHLTVSVRCNKCSARGPATGSRITVMEKDGKRIPENSMYEWELRDIAIAKWNARANKIVAGNGQDYEVVQG